MMARTFPTVDLPVPEKPVRYILFFINRTLPDFRSKVPHQSTTEVLIEIILTIPELRYGLTLIFIIMDN